MFGDVGPVFSCPLLGGHVYRLIRKLGPMHAAEDYMLCLEPFGGAYIGVRVALLWKRWQLDLTSGDWTLSLKIFVYGGHLNANVGADKVSTKCNHEAVRLDSIVQDSGLESDQ